MNIVPRMLIAEFPTHTSTVESGCCAAASTNSPPLRTETENLPRHVLLTLTLLFSAIRSREPSSSMRMQREFAPVVTV
jgi:hypothetical protein